SENRATVDAAGKITADGNVRLEAERDGVDEAVADSLDVFFGRSGEIALVFFWEIHVPVALLGYVERFSASADDEHVSGFDGADSFKRAGARNHGVHQLVEERLVVEFRRDFGIRDDGFHFGTPVNRAV